MPILVRWAWPGVSLSPAFSSGTTLYKARVQASEVTVSYSLSDTAGGASAAMTAANSNGADITDDNVDGMEVTLAAAAGEDELTGGTTTITVMVTPESVDVDDNNTCDTAGIKCYMIEVYRIRANESDNANLATLILAPVPSTEAIVDNINLSTNDLVARVTNDTTHVTVGSHRWPTCGGATFVISVLQTRVLAQIQ